MVFITGPSWWLQGQTVVLMYWEDLNIIIMNRLHLMFWEWVNHIHYLKVREELKRNVPYSSKTGAAWMNYLWSSWTGSALWQRIWKRCTVSLKVCTVTKFDVLKNKLSEKQTKQLIHFCFHFITVSWFLQFSIKDAGNFARSLQHRNIPNHGET